MTATVRRVRSLNVTAPTAAVLGGFAGLPTSGPSSAEIQDSTATAGTAAVQIVDVDDRVAHQPLAQRRVSQFAETLGHDVAQLARRLFNMADALQPSPAASRFRFAGSSRALRTVVGRVDGVVLKFTGEAGHLLFGPYIAVPTRR